MLAATSGDRADVLVSLSVVIGLGATIITAASSTSTPSMPRSPS